MLTPEQRQAMEYACFYRERGFNPLPSRMDEKRPFARYAHLWNEIAPPEWFTEDGWPATTNVQVMCGARWGLFVVDLDGSEAKDRWDAWCREHKRPRTWVSRRDGGDSYHWWFKIPAWHKTPIKKCFVWKGAGEHQGIEILGERSLVVAPPSRHVKTGGQYRFLRGCSYRDMGLPAVAPGWVLNLKPIETRVHAAEFVPPPPRLATRTVNEEVFMDRNAILDSIHDKVSLARQWGVRFTGHVSPDGWAECHAIGRPDHDPSAAMHVHTGVYTDRGAHHKPLPFFDLMVAMGQAHDFADARARLAECI